MLAYNQYCILLFKPRTGVAAQNAVWVFNGQRVENRQKESSLLSGWTTLYSLLSDLYDNGHVACTSISNEEVCPCAKR
jgi:hypothetical protein